MKTKHAGLLISGVILSFALSSCDSLLDIPQHGVLNKNTYYTTDQDAAEALAAIYSVWAENFTYNNYLIKNIMADDTWLGGNGPADIAAGAALSRAYYDSKNQRIQILYKSYYQVINRANLLLEGFEKSADTRVKRNAVAEARFFRAWAYYELVSLWDNPPLVKKVLGADEGKVKNTLGDETWSFIEDELESIIASGDLTEKSGTDDVQAGIRPTVQTAEALLGRVYMFRGKYAEALTQFESVISSEKYRLVTGQEYLDLFHGDGNSSPEYLLSNNTVYDKQNGYWNGDQTYYGADNFALMNNWGWMNKNFRVYDQEKYTAYFGADSLMNLSGYQCFHPTQKLADAFVALEGKDGYRLNKTILSDDKMHDEVGVWPGGDQRCFEHCGWFRIKGIPRMEDFFPEGTLGVAFNLPEMRYAEILLLAAEAGFKTGSPKALGYFNQVRTRAQAPLASTLDMATIQNEFFLETCFEGHRFQDLKRWDLNGDIDMTATLADKGKVNTYFTEVPPSASDAYPKVRSSFIHDSWLFYIPAAESRAGFEDYEKTLPYPQAELDVNPNIVQNQGWEVNL